MKTVLLEGISRHGKEQVTQFGGKWKIVDRSISQFKVVPIGPDAEQHWRWVGVMVDKHMKITFGLGQALVMVLEHDEKGRPKEGWGFQLWPG